LYSEIPGIAFSKDSPPRPIRDLVDFIDAIIVDATAFILPASERMIGFPQSFIAVDRQPSWDCRRLPRIIVEMP